MSTIKSFSIPRERSYTTCSKDKESSFIESMTTYISNYLCSHIYKHTSKTPSKTPSKPSPKPSPKTPSKPSPKTPSKPSPKPSPKPPSRSRSKTYPSDFSIDENISCPYTFNIISRMKNGNSSFEKLCYLKSSEINKLIHNVKILSHNSSSLTDTWIVTFKKDIQKELNVKSAFMKISIDYNSYSIYENRMVHLYLGSYKVENMIHGYINILMEKKITMNFVKLLTYREDVSFQDMVSILSNKSVNDCILNEIDACNNFKRNMVNSIDRINRHNHQSIRKRQIKTQTSGNWTYRFLMTEAINEENCISSRDYFKSLKLNGVCFTMNTWNILFQISHACLVMERFNIAHNDLHLSNIWLKLNQNQDEYFTYIVEDSVYNFKSKYIPLIYDFDRGYMEYSSFSFSHKIHVNNTMTRDSIRQNNEIVKGRDFIRFLCFLCIEFVISERDLFKIINCIAKTEESKTNLRYYFTLSTIDYEILDENFLIDNVLSMNEIMNNIFSDLYGYKNESVLAKKENVYKLV